MPNQPMDKSAASRIQSSQAKNNNDVGAGSFAARAQSAADTRANTQGTQGQANTGSKNSMQKKLMTKEDASRIQSSQAKHHRFVSAGSFAARAQSAADTRANNQGQSKKKPGSKK
ncbi:hypothetical protein INT47_006830 [Mucor saturninus]|uniref:SMP domain-containing protein n=1 Tax=Mucor saturninus TaxID=64648 RepID=A0A8H7RA30_9FUNG|nr:hypothetical protein INT47_006830 [Mucor saturninus]